MRRSNVFIIAKILLDYFIVSGLLWIMAEGLILSFIDCMVLGLSIFLIYLVFTLSPIGDWYLRKKFGVNKITNKKMCLFIEPIFYEVYQQAQILDPTLPNNIQLFLSDKTNISASAIGRKTICISKGVLLCKTEIIKAIIAHEFGHLSNRDTVLLLISATDDFIINSYVLFINIIFLCLKIIMYFVIDGLEYIFLSVIAFLLVKVIVFLWKKLGIFLLMKSKRSSEFAADDFVNELGYGKEFCLFLNCFEPIEHQGFLKSLKDTHPDCEDRIDHLQEMGFKSQDSMHLNLYDYCPYCGYVIEDDDVYCIHCGYKLKKEG